MQTTQLGTSSSMHCSNLESSHAWNNRQLPACLEFCATRGSGGFGGGVGGGVVGKAGVVAVALMEVMGAARY